LAREARPLTARHGTPLLMQLRRVSASATPRSNSVFAEPLAIFIIFSLLHIGTNVLLLNLHKTHAEISLFYLNLQRNIFVAFGILWWYN